MHDFLLILHLLLFCYWLGGDIGVFYASGLAADSSLGLEGRMTAARIMLTLDIVPRLCGAVMLTVGGLLSQYAGISHPGWQLAAILLLAPLWLALELILHFRQGTPLGQAAARLDNPFKVAILIACLVSVGWSFRDGSAGRRTLGRLQDSCLRVDRFLQSDDQPDGRALRNRHSAYCGRRNQLGRERSHGRKSAAGEVGRDRNLGRVSARNRAGCRQARLIASSMRVGESGTPAVNLETQARAHADLPRRWGNCEAVAGERKQVRVRPLGGSHEAETL